MKWGLSFDVHERCRRAGREQFLDKSDVPPTGRKVKRSLITIVLRIQLGSGLHQHLGRCFLPETDRPMQWSVIKVVGQVYILVGSDVG